MSIAAPARLLVIVVLAGSIVSSGVAVGVERIDGGGAGSAGTLGGQPAVSPATVESGETTDAHLVTFTARNVSADGGPDPVAVTLPDALADDGLGINDVRAETVATGEQVPLAGDPFVSDGPDNDNVIDSVAFAVNPDRADSAVDLNIQLNVTTTASTIGTTTDYEINATVEDSDESRVAEVPIATVTVEGVDTPESEPATTTAPPTTSVVESPASPSSETTSMLAPTSTPLPTSSQSDPTTSQSPTATARSTPSVTAPTQDQPTTTDPSSADEPDSTTSSADGGDADGGSVAPTNSPTVASGPGFTPEIAIGGLLVGALVARRWQR